MSCECYQVFYIFGLFCCVCSCINSLFIRNRRHIPESQNFSLPETSPLDQYSLHHPSTPPLPQPQPHFPISLNLSHSLVLVNTIDILLLPPPCHVLWLYFSGAFVFGSRFYHVLLFAPPSHQLKQTKPKNKRTTTNQLTDQYKVYIAGRGGVLG